MSQLTPHYVLLPNTLPHPFTSNNYGSVIADRLTEALTLNLALRYMTKSLLIDTALWECQLVGTHTRTFQNKLTKQREQVDLQPMHKLKRVDNGVSEQLK